MDHSRIISVPIRDLKSSLAAIETDQIIFICDRSIEMIYAPLVQELRKMKGKSVFYWCGVGGEANKTFEQYEKCMNELLSFGIHRHSHVIAVGGGALSDFAGFVAATLLRGVDWSIVPTTLLAQVDAGIGGKTAINSSQGKNLVGCFHFPRNIFLCKEFLLTLEARDYQSGMGEVVKYALLNEEIFESIMNGQELDKIIQQCSRFKKKVVIQDPYEKRERKYLNLGHTFGHAYEFLTRESHGMSVLWGIEYIDRNFLKSRLEKQYRELLRKLQIRPCFLTIKENDLLSYLYRDKKKISQSEIQLVLLEGVGRPYLKTFPVDQLNLNSSHP